MSNGGEIKRRNYLRLLPKNLAPAKFFLITALIFGLFFVLINPPFFGLDERAHFLRAYEISEGRFMPTKINGHWGAPIPKNIAELVNISTNDLIDSPRTDSVLGHKDAQIEKYRPYYHQPVSTKKVDDLASSTQLAGTFGYNPVVYLPLASVVKISEILKLNVLPILYVTRFFNLVLYIAIIYMAIRIIPRYKWLIALIALLPTALFQASIVSVDPIINASALLLFALLINMAYKERLAMLTRTRLLVILVVIVMILAKPPYILLIMPFLFLGKDVFQGRRQYYLWKLLWITLPLTAYLVWSHIDNSTTKDVVSALTPSANFSLQQHYVITHPATFLKDIFRTYFEYIDTLFGGMIGKIGDRQVGAPYSILTLLFIFGTGLSVFINETGPKVKKIHIHYKNPIFIITAFLIITGITLGLYLIFTPVGANSILGIQGRYFIPVLPLLLVPVSETFKFKSVDQNLMIKIVSSSAVILLGITSILYYTVNY